MNFLIMNPYDDVFRKVLEEGARFRSMTQGYGLGSGNSLPDFMSGEGFRAMIDATFELRKREK
jgi:hypothetical protein